MIRLLGFLCLLSAPTFAGMLGTMVTFNYDLNGSVFGPSTAVVGPGVEFSCPDASTAACTPLTIATQTLDFGDFSIEYRVTGGAGGFIDPAGFNGFRLSGLDLAPGIMLTTNITGLTLANFTSTATTLDVRMNGRPVQDGSFWRVTVIPEPSTFALFGAALVGLAAAVRRRR